MELWEYAVGNLPAWLTVALLLVVRLAIWFPDTARDLG